MQSLPGLGRLVPNGPYGRFPPNVLFGDIVKGLPLPDGAVSLLYCSHVLEHLCLVDLRQALLNCRRVLQAGEVFRVVLPDLEYLIRCYNVDASPTAAVTFMEDTLLGKKARRRGLGGFAREWLGNRQHQSMWDYKALAMELQAAGFESIRRASLGDSGIPAFDLVETAERWNNALGIQCT
jgi:ubiquinone/menaquinone biosynthesis C-methylase UbiE